MRLLLSVARRRRFERGEVVFHHHDPADSLHLIESGHFAIRVMTPVGSTVWVAVRGPGEHFGELALIDEAVPRSATVSALEPGATFAVHRPDFERLRRTHAGIDRILIALLAGELRIMNDRLLEALYISAEKRLLRRLHELASIYATDDGAALIPLTQEELAEFAGTSRATVNRVLREEQARGTLELKRGKMHVLDLEILAKRAR